MTQALVTLPGTGTLAPASAAADLARNARSAATMRAYRSGWADYTLWCEGVGRQAMPASPQTVADYIAHLVAVGARVSTISQRLAAISTAHKLAGHTEPNPARTEQVREVMQGVRRTIGTRPNKKRAVSLAELRAMCEAQPETPAGLRNRALMSMQWSGAMRRSEVVALRVEDVDRGAAELQVMIERSKTDQEGRGLVKILSSTKSPACCPVRTLAAWLAASGITAGPIFRAIDRNGHVRAEALSGFSVASIWKSAAAAVGMSIGDVSGHSARRGFITAAYRAELPEADIMAHTGHKSTEVMRGYRADSGAASRKVGRVVMNEDAT
jgi:integrase